MAEKKVVKRNFESRTDEALKGLQIVPTGAARTETASASQPGIPKTRRAPRPEEISVIEKLIDYFKAIE